MFTLVCYPSLQTTVALSLFIANNPIGVKNSQCRNVGETYNPFNMTSSVRPCTLFFSKRVPFRIYTTTTTTTTKPVLFFNTLFDILSEITCPQ